MPVSHCSFCFYYMHQFKHEQYSQGNDQIMIIIDGCRHAVTRMTLKFRPLEWSQMLLNLRFNKKIIDMCSSF